MKNLKKIAILASIYKALHKIEVQNSGDTFEDLQDTYEFSKNHDYERDKDDFGMEI